MRNQDRKLRQKFAEECPHLADIYTWKKWYKDIAYVRAEIENLVRQVKEKNLT